MNRPVRAVLNKGSKTNKQSYMSRYKQKSELTSNLGGKASDNGRGGWKQQEIRERRDKIKDKIHRQTEVSRMRIEDDSIEDEFFKDENQSIQIMWTQKIKEVQEQTEKLKQIKLQELKIIRNLGEEVKNKKNTIRELQFQLEETSRKILNKQEVQVNPVSQQQENYEKHIKNLIKLIEESEKDIQILKAERYTLMAKNTELAQLIQKAKTSISEGNDESSFEEEQISFQAMSPKIMSLEKELNKLQTENVRLEQTLQLKRDSIEFQSQDLSFNFDIAEKMFIIRQLQKFEQLMEVKGKELKRMEQFERNREFIKTKTKENEAIEKEIKKKNDIIHEITDKIKLISMEMMNSFDY